MNLGSKYIVGKDVCCLVCLQSHINKKAFKKWYSLKNQHHIWGGSQWWDKRTQDLHYYINIKFSCTLIIFWACTQFYWDVFVLETSCFHTATVIKFLQNSFWDITEYICTIRLIYKYSPLYLRSLSFLQA